MKRIAVHGSYFGYNFGDTLLCKIFTKHVKNSPDDCLTVSPLANAKNKYFIDSDQKGLLSTLFSDALVLCGGGYFSASPTAGRRWVLRAYTRHIILCYLFMWLGRPIIIQGVGVGPIPSKKLAKDVAKIFNYASEVVVRDRESEQYLRGIGVNRDIKVSADAAISLNIDDFKPSIPDDMTQVIKLARDDGKNIVVVHTSTFANDQELSVINEVRKLCDNDPKIQLILITDSLPRTKRLTWIDKADFSPSAYKYYYSGQVDELVSILNQADIVITTKLHVGIVSTALKKAVISIPHHGKTVRFYRQMALSDQCIEHKSGWENALSIKLKSFINGDRPEFSEFDLIRGNLSYQDQINNFIAEAK